MSTLKQISAEHSRIGCMTVILGVNIGEKIRNNKK